QVQPDGRRARAAVVGEGDGPLRAVLDAVARVGDEEDARSRLALPLAQHESARRSGVAYLLAADDRPVLRSDELVLHLRPIRGILLAVLVVLAVLDVLGRLRVGGAQAEHGEENGEPKNSTAHDGISYGQARERAASCTARKDFA